MTTLRTITTNKGKLILAVAIASMLVFLFLAGCAKTADTEKPQDASTQSTAADNAAAEKRPPASYTFTDDLGNEVTVSDPKRVIACMGSFANIWELAGGSLVGASDDALADYSLSSPNIASIGDFTAPNLELIISLEPDFVLMTGASTGRNGAASQVDLKQSLEDSGITVAYFNVTSFEDYLRMLSVCSSITGREDLYEENGTAVEERIAKIKAEAASRTEKPTVLLMTTYSGGTRVQDSKTMTGIMLSELGAINLADQNPSLLKDFSLEAIIEMDPQHILVVPMGNDDAAAMKNLEEATAANPAWAGLQAVKNGNYQTLDKSLFLYKPTKHWDESYQVLFDLLYS